jgi:hypothetical protein
MSNICTHNIWESSVFLVGNGKYVSNFSLYFAKTGGKFETVREIGCEWFHISSTVFSEFSIVFRIMEK